MTMNLGVRELRQDLREDQDKREALGFNLCVLTVKLCQALWGNAKE